MLDYLSREVIRTYLVLRHHKHDARSKLLIPTNAGTLLDQNKAKAKVEREVLWKFSFRKQAMPFFRHWKFLNCYSHTH